ncbi:uncharacterized protein LOC124255271 [Haliotis rubra]|uniref:uncharacterized protein LOC124255271 n=1 Tax=Haliotis rubra TaxID=36100 RepID=UPI001EE564ED|nr:uncharacterized protein LOC124255271 [Haliotis rubra]
MNNLTEKSVTSPSPGEEVLVLDENTNIDMDLPAEAEQEIHFQSGMDCPACLERSIFTHFPAFQRHWTMRHRPQLTIFHCPVLDCRATYHMFPDLTRHYMRHHTSKRANPKNMIQACRKARTTVATDKGFMDPEKWTFPARKSKKAAKFTPAASQSTQKELPAEPVDVQSAPEPTEKESRPVSVGEVIPNQWELAYDRAQLEIQALKCQVSQLERQIARSVPSWLTTFDIPVTRPTLDDFIRSGREAMAVLHEAEDRRFNEQLPLRRQADAYIRIMTK